MSTKFKDASLIVIYVLIKPIMFYQKVMSHAQMNIILILEILIEWGEFGKTRPPGFTFRNIINKFYFNESFVVEFDT